MKLDWQKIIIGIRKKLNLSATKLGKKINLGRQTICRYEFKQRTPNEDSTLKILKFIQENGLDIKELEKIGEKYKEEYKNRIKIKKLNLKNSIELAELIGIILGDGEVRKDGTIRISFDPKKDKNYLNRRIFFLIKKLLNNKIGFESYKRIRFGNIAFVRYLEGINIKAGSKFENNWEIPDWCFEANRYLSAVLRGLFDTDGYFGYWGGSLEIMFGRFSRKCKGLVNSISRGLEILKINHIVRQGKDKRYKVVMNSKAGIIKFLNLVGTSNLRHITRFLLWRIDRYEAKIELEGLNSLIKKTNELIKINVEDIDLPFFWNLNNKYFHNYIKEDIGEVKGAGIRKLYKWNKILKKLIVLVGDRGLANQFNITERSVRKWREGIRDPSNKFILKLIKLSKDNNLNLDDYEVK